MSESPSSNVLWQQIMNKVLKNHGDSQKKKWRIVTNKSAECQLCDELGGGVLIRCTTDKCNKEFHLDCAFHQGGLSLEDNGIINFQCEAHYKPVLFCTCKEKYDDSQAMIFCDECCEWYHDSCLGLNPKEAQRIDRFVCSHCKSILANGKTISKAMKDRNLAKEYQSACHQTAMKAFGLLVELSGSVCPLIDDLSTRDNSSQYTMKEIQDAQEYLSAPPFDLSGVAPGPEGELPDNLIDTVGAQGLVDSWRQTVSQYVAKYDKWLSGATDVFSSMSTKITLSLGEEQLSVVQELASDLARLDSSLQSELQSIPKDSHAFYAFQDCVAWMLEFLQILHTSVKSEQWFNQLGGMLKSAAPKAKLLSSVCRDHFTEPFVGYFQSYLKLVQQTLSSLTSWYSQACDILNQDLLYNLSDIEKFVQTARDFPATPFLFDELTRLVERSVEVEGRIQTQLNRVEADEAVLQSLSEEKNDLSVILPSDAALGAVDEKLIFLKAYGMALGTERLRLDLVESLVTEGREVTLSHSSDDAVVVSVLGTALDQQVQTAIDSLEQLVQRAKIVRDATAPDLLTGEGDFSSALASLQNLQILTPEEELFVFLEASNVIQSSTQTILDRREPVPLSDVEALIDRLEGTLEITTIDKFPVVVGHKLSLGKSLSALLDVQTTARKLWCIVEDYTRECEQGIERVTREELDEALQAATQTLLVDQAAEDRATQLLSRAEEVSRTCVDQLQAITETSAQSLLEVQGLLDTVRLLPVRKALGALVQRKYDVCSTVFHCQKYLTAAATGVHENSFDKDATLLRDLHHALDRLSAEVGDASETAMLRSVKTEFVLYCWCFEVRYLWKKQNSSLSTAETLLKEGQLLGESAQQTPEWHDLSGEVTNARQHSAEATAVLNRFKQLREEVNALRESDDAMEVDGDSHAFRIAGHKTLTDRMALWSTQSQSLLSGLDGLLRVECTTKITQTDLSVELRQALDETSLLSSAAEIVVTINRTFDASPESAFKEQQVVDFRDVTAMANRLSLAAEKDASFLLLRDLSAQMSLFHSAASKWSEQTQNLLPQKATRNKSKSDAKTTSESDLHAALTVPIARAVRMPMHEKIEQTLSDATVFRAELVAFLLPSSPIKKNGESDFPIDFDAQLFSDTTELYRLRQSGELIPLDLSEFRVLSWAVEVAEWMRGVPLPDEDTTKVTGITLGAARLKVRQGVAIFSEKSSSLVDALVGMNLVCVENGVEKFSSNAHHTFKCSQLMFSNLVEQVKRTEDFQNKLRTAITTQKITSEAHQQFLQEIGQLVVQIEGSSRRALEKALHGGASTAGSSSSAGSTRYYDDDDEEEDDFSSIKDGRGVDGDYLSDASDEREDAQVYLSGEGAGSYWADSSSPTSLKSRARKTDVAIKRKLDGGVDISAAKADMLLAREKFAKKAKLALPQCAHVACEKDATDNTSNYCSDSHAVSSAPDLLTALLKYRDVLSLHSGMKNMSLNETQKQQISKIPSADIAAFEIKSSDHSQQANADVSGTASTDRRGSTLQNLFSTLPVAATYALFRGDTDEPGAIAKPSMHAPSSKGAPPSVPLLSSSGLSADEEMRLKVRYSVEDFLAKVLLRLEVPGAMATGAFFALELEDELCAKYAFAARPGVLRREFDKKEYRKHHLMLMRNLKQVHNDQLILKLVSNEVTMEKLLAMTAQQLADSSTQILRQQQLTSVVSGFQRVSTEEVLEAKRREVMTGNETWRDSSSNLTALLTPTAASNGAPVEEERKGPEGGARLEKSRSLEIEQMVSRQQSGSSSGSGQGSSTPTAKRSIDVDAMTRFTTSASKDKTAKVPRIEVDTTSSSTTKARDPSSPKVAMGESPRSKSSAPNMLNIIKANASNGTPTQVAATTTSFSAIPSPASALNIRTPAVATYSIINTVGGNTFNVNRPGGVNIVCTGTLTDRRGQGLIKDAFSVQGRTRIAELEKFVNDLLDAHKKVVVAFRLTESEGALGPDSGYQRFVDEFSKDLRAGMCTMSEGVQAYLVPPALKHHISLLSTIKEDSGSRTDNVLYGVLVSREQGPEEYVHASTAAVESPSGHMDVVEEKKVSAAFGEAKPVPASPTPVAKPAVVVAPTAPPSAPAHTTQISSSNISSSSSSGPPARPTFPQPVKPATTVPVTLNAFTANAARIAVAPVAPAVVVNAAVSSAPANAKQQHLNDTIKKVAQFCAAKGVATLQTLKDKAESKTLMPFLYEGQPGYMDFMMQLKECVQANKAASAAPPVQPNGGGDRLSRFAPK